jgi:hypothetical protein
MFSNLNHSIFQTEKDESQYEEGKVRGVRVSEGGVSEGGGNKYKNTLKKEKYIDTLYDDDFIKNYFL